MKYFVIIFLLERFNEINTLVSNKFSLHVCLKKGKNLVKGESIALKIKLKTNMNNSVVSANSLYLHSYKFTDINNKMFFK